MPPEAEEGRVRARASQEEDAAAPTFDVLMPTLIPQFDDELQGDRGAQEPTPPTSRPAAAACSTPPSARSSASKAFVNTHWPPVPPED